MNKKVNPLKEKAIKTLYQNGFGFKEVREVVKVGISTIQRVLKENNVPSHPYNKVVITEEDMRAIRQRIEHGELKRDIAASLGITPSAISKRLARKKEVV